MPKTKTNDPGAHHASSGALIRRFLPYLAKYKMTLFLDLFCAALTTLCDIVLPKIMSTITNAAMGVGITLTAGIVLTVLGMTLTPQLLRLMKTDADVLPNSIDYFRMYFAGSIAMVMYNLCVGILQAVGDSRHPLYYLILSSLVNIALDLLFVGVFHWGVWSAALATSISQFVSLGLCIFRLCHYDTVYRVRLRKIRFHLPMLKQVIHFGLPSGVQNSIIAFANVIVQSNINAFGSPWRAAAPMPSSRALPSFPSPASRWR